MAGEILVASMLDLVWAAATDAATSNRFTDAEGTLDEGRLVAYQDQVLEHLFSIFRDAVEAAQWRPWSDYMATKQLVLHQFTLAWWGAVDAFNSPDFRLDDGSPNHVAREEFRVNVRTEGVAKIMEDVW